MESLFPTLLDFSFVAIGLLRVVVGVVHMNAGASLLRSGSRWLGWTRTLLGFFLLVGLFTQLAALLLSAYLAITLSKKKPVGHTEKHFAALLIATTLFFVVSGAGAFAFDLPL